MKIKFMNKSFPLMIITKVSWFILSISLLSCGMSSNEPSQELGTADDANENALKSAMPMEEKAKGTESEAEQSTVTETTPQKAPVTLRGEINERYAISMSLTRSKKDIYAESLQGYYAYNNSVGHLSLEGYMNSQGHFRLDEKDEKGTMTGYFIGEITEENKMQGTWYSGNNEKSFPFTLEGSDGKINLIEELSPKDLYGLGIKKIKRLGDYGMKGTYCWYSSHLTEGVSGRMEIIENEGTISIDRVDNNKFKFNLLAVCGPTYHIAMASGIAEKQGAHYVAVVGNEYGGDGCELIFKFTGRSVEIEQDSPGMACGFGARAYAGGTYEKVHPGYFQQGENGNGLVGFYEGVKDFVGL